MTQHESLIAHGRGATAEGCPIDHCDRPMIPFRSDREAVEHIASHTMEDLVWALLEHKAIIAEFLDVVDEDDAEDLLKSVRAAAAQSRRGRL
ncbi:hypothetical protein [Streptomyces sp. NPDC090022]|uniref:hypothetical protein n=1 Tax=Streptomyces sp. NPDC090022 TaxID=3365920 RepID=UPI003813832B